MAEERQPLVAVDLNDLSLNTEQLGDDFNPDADAFAFAPPPDDGVHRVKLGYGQDKWKQGVSKQDKQYLMAHLQLSPVDEKGWILFDRPSTMVFGSGTSRVAGIIKAVTGQPAKARDTVSLAREFDGLVQGERIVKVETRWIAQCSHGEIDPNTGKEKYHTIKAGQTKFPPLEGTANGGGPKYSPEIECPKCHAMINVQAQIVKYLSDSGQAQAAAAGQAATATDINDNPFN